MLSHCLYWMDRVPEQTKEQEKTDQMLQDLGEKRVKRYAKPGEFRSDKVVDGHRVCFLGRETSAGKLGRNPDACRNWIDCLLGIQRKRRAHDNRGRRA